MGAIVITLPKQAQIDDFEVKMMVAGGLYEKGKLSAGEAAVIAGLSKKAFIEIMGKYGFSVFGYTSKELKEDIQDLASWKKQ